MQSRPHRAGKAPEETLDPEDWADAQAVAHRAVDDAIAYLRDIRDRPVWRDMPGEVRRTFEHALAPFAHATVGGLRRNCRNIDALPDGQHPSAFLGLVHGVEQLHRSAGLTFWPRSRVPTLAAGITPPPGWTSRSLTGARR